MKYIKNYYYLLCMHAVFMGTTTATTDHFDGTTTAVVVMRRCPVMVFEKPEVLDKAG